ncbi:dTDP-rhamnosyl transferase [Desulfosarcina variabilis str. Montpellier]
MILNKKCCAVCITYEPNFSLLDSVIKSTLAQVDRLYIVDNGSKNVNWTSIIKSNHIDLVRLKKNFGVAYALNKGIKLAIESKYRYVLLLDQDSIPPKGMINRYTEVIRKIEKRDKLVAGIGPRYMNKNMGNISRFVRFKWFHNQYCGSDTEDKIVQADFLITSGSFYDLSIFNKVGLFNESLFIDHIDTEWCIRATHKGFKFYGIWDVIMQHSLGEDSIKLWFIRWRYQPIHKPFRLYFIIRNSILLYRMPFAKLKWISGDIVRLLRLALMYSFFLPNRLQSIKWLIKGLFDGFKGITGGNIISNN